MTILPIPLYSAVLFDDEVLPRALDMCMPEKTGTIGPAFTIRLRENGQGDLSLPGLWQKTKEGIEHVLCSALSLSELDPHGGPLLKMMFSGQLASCAEIILASMEIGNGYTRPIRSLAVMRGGVVVVAERPMTEMEVLLKTGMTAVDMSEKIFAAIADSRLSAHQKFDFVHNAEQFLTQLWETDAQGMFSPVNPLGTTPKFIFEATQQDQ